MMKKWISIAISLLLSAILIACTGTQQRLPDDTFGEPGSSTVPDHAHTYEVNTVSPSCTEGGYTTYTCACGDTYKADEKVALGHSWSEWETTKQPTEAETGTAKRICAACGQPEARTLDKLEADHQHSYTSDVSRNATCTEDGTRTFLCSCGDSYTELIEKLGHDYKNVVTAPTCTNDGYTTHTCSRCSSSYIDSMVEATGHSYSSAVTKAASCTEAGVKTYTCGKCSSQYTDSIAKLDHDYRTEVIDPTCTQKGYTLHKCNRCNDSYKDTYTDMKEHSYTAIVSREPTCSQDGVRTYTCTCGKSYTEAIAKAAHNYTSITVDPTCTAGGYTKQTCTICGNNSKSDITAALGHDYRDTIVAPGCENGGYTLHKCSRCNNSYKDTQTPAAGHTYAFTSDTATCTSNGVKTETCDRCGNKKTSTSSATGHIHTKTAEKAADCVHEGYVRVLCADCGCVVSETIIPSDGGHNYVVRRMSNVVEEQIEKGILSYASYGNLTDWNIDVCSHCGYFDLNTLRFAYTQYEAAEIMLGYVNELRASYYGTDEYAMELDVTLIELANIRAKEIITDFSHKNVADSENIAMGGNTIYEHFMQWYNSSGHKSAMLGKHFVKFGYGFAWTRGRGVPIGYGVQLFMLPDNW